MVMALTASDACKRLFSLIEQVNSDRTTVEIIAKHGNAGLMSADDYAAWVETAYLFRSAANARRLIWSGCRPASSRSRRHRRRQSWWMGDR